MRKTTGLAGGWFLLHIDASNDRRLLLDRLHGGEEQHVADGGAVGQQHHQTVEAEAQAARGGHAVLEGVDEVLIHLGIDALRLARGNLLFETAALIDRIVQLGEGVAHLVAVDEELEALGEGGILGKWSKNGVRWCKLTGWQSEKNQRRAG